MSSRLSALAMTLLLVACGGSGGAEGHYVTTPESVRASFEATFPPAEDPNGMKLRARFEQLQGDASVALDLEPDSSFALTMRLPGVPKPVTRSGTWTRSGTTVQLQVTHEHGQPLSQPMTRTATLERDTVTLQDTPHAPRFVLQKK